MPDPNPTLRNRMLLDELTRQRDVLARDLSYRLLATMVAFGACAIFLPVHLIALFVGMNLLSETAAHRLMLDPVRLLRPGAYRLHLVLALLAQASFVLPSAFLWLLPDVFAKTLAIGMLTGSMLHVATVRAIHLPTGLAAGLAIGLSIFGFNTILWVTEGDIPGFVISTLCAALFFGYFINAMLSNNRLHREAAAARVAAEATDAAKGRFLAQMSHELRTPLNAILGMGEALLRGTRDDVSRTRLSVLIASAEGLTTILDDILDLSAVQEGRVPIRPRNADPAAEIAATVALFRPRAEEAGLALRLDLAPDLPDCAAFDPQRLRQCLSNLLSNALKFTEAGQITVAARAEPAGVGQLLRIEVADTGPGIPEADRDTLFQPFSTGTSVRPRQGAGLGLSISRTLARRMGGDLVLMQAPGARFALTLALAPRLPESTDTRTRPGTALSGLRVLVVDDIATNRLVAEAHLRALGIRTVQAASGRVALDWLAGEKSDLILLDMNMPDLDGLETLRHIRALPGSAASTPVIAMTADALPEQRERYLAEGLDGYLSKPLSTESLRQELQRVIAARTN